jgi:hypothetical protein
MNENKRRLETVGVAAIAGGLTVYLGTINQSPVTWGIVAAVIGGVLYAISVGLTDEVDDAKSK